MPRLTPLFSVVLCGCPWIGAPDVDALVDADGDGEPAVAFGGIDCDDADPDVVVLQLYRDLDRDGHGDPNAPLAVCTPDGAALADDCDDEDPALGGPSQRFADRDDDGWGGVESTLSCPATGLVERSGDCDDTDKSLHLDDADGDGFSPCTGDCNDADETVTTVPRWEDFDGDGLGDEARPAPTCFTGVLEAGDCDDTDARIRGEQPFFHDGDGDGDGAGEPLGRRCPTPGVVFTNTDCNDDDRHLDGIDRDGDGYNLCTVPQDCDDTDPTAQLEFLAYPDLDGDGFGAGAPTRTCGFGANLAFLAGDCDDRAPGTYPGATEICAPFGQPQVDEDCSGVPDDGPGLVGHEYVLDGDGDGYPGEAELAALVTHCVYPPPPGFLELDPDLEVDCDPVDPTVHPDTEFYVDADGDGFGAESDSVESCEAPAGHARTADDCDDGNPDVNPDTIWYVDPDGDGFAVGTEPDRHCVPEDATGWSYRLGDCAPERADLHPGARELAATVEDLDCDGLLPGDRLDRCPWRWPDEDGDGWGNPDARPERRCSAVGGWALVPADPSDVTDQAIPVEVDVATEAELVDALLIADEPGVSITLTADITLSAPLVLATAATTVVDGAGHRLRGEIVANHGNAFWFVDGRFGDGRRALSAANARIGVADAVLDGAVTATDVTYAVRIHGSTVRADEVAISRPDGPGTMLLTIVESVIEAPRAIEFVGYGADLRRSLVRGSVDLTCTTTVDLADVDLASNAPDRPALFVGQAQGGLNVVRSTIAGRGTALQTAVVADLDQVALASAEGFAFDGMRLALPLLSRSALQAAPGLLVDSAAADLSDVSGEAFVSASELVDPERWDLHLRNGGDATHGAFPDDPDCVPDSVAGTTCRARYEIDPQGGAPLGWYRTWFGVTDPSLLVVDLAGADSDLDGVTNEAEYTRGTDPLRP